jgi:TPR repeat protein
MSRALIFILLILGAVVVYFQTGKKNAEEDVQTKNETGQGIDAVNAGTPLPIIESTAEAVFPTENGQLATNTGESIDMTATETLAPSPTPFVIENYIAELRKLCAGGKMLSCRELASFLRSNKLYPEESRALYEKLCQKTTGDTIPCDRAANNLNASQIADYEKACTEGKTYACYIAGVAQVDNNSAGAKKYITLACENGFTLESCAARGILLSEQEKIALEPKCNSGDRKACMSLAGYEKNRNNTENLKKYLELTCKLGAAEGCAGLGVMLDKQQIKEKIDKCMQANLPNASDCIQAGAAVEMDTKNGKPEALKYFERACKLGHSEMCEKLQKANEVGGL